MPPTEDRRAAILRRGLLAFVTALVVARPLVLGEDPGLLTQLSGTSSLVLSVLWLVAAVAWAAWRFWFRQETGSRCPVELGLAVVVGLVVISALGGARYRHPALLIAWEWLVLLLAFGLVRRLARSPEDIRGLLAALLATGVSLSVHAVYQSAYEMQGNRQLAENPEELREAGTRLFGPLESDDPRLADLKKRLLMDHAFATYAHPNSFAGYLALLLPAAVGWMLVGVKRRGTSVPRWRMLLAAGCASLLIVALWLTHSRGAILGLLLVGLSIFLTWQIRRGKKRNVALLISSTGVVLIFAFFLFPSAFDKAWRSVGLRTEYWSATWAMIRDHTWLGVGPGNFGRHYPRYMAAAAFEKVQDPHNFVLEIWATSGLFTLLALLATLGVFFWRNWSTVRRTEFIPFAQNGMNSVLRTTDYTPSPRWDLYLGGLAGLILGFLLRAQDLSADGFVVEAAASVVRSVIWLAVFALLEGIPWSGRSLTLALAAGAAALLLNLSISGGIALPSVAQPLWVMAALALNSAWKQPEPQARAASRNWLYWFLPLPVLAGLAAAYLGFFFRPVTHCLVALVEARRNYGDDPSLPPGWRNRILPEWESQMERGSAQQKLEATREARLFLSRKIIDPLKAAAVADPGNSAPPLELAFWYGEQGKLLLGATPSETSLNWANKARHLDPDNKEVYLAEYRIHRQMAQQFPGRETESNRRAAEALQAAVDLDPTEARLHYDLAEAWFLAGDGVKGREQAALAKELDEQATVASRHLSDKQRAQIRKWLAVTD